MDKQRLYEMNKLAANTYYLYLLHGKGDSGYRSAEKMPTENSGYKYLVKERELTLKTVYEYGLGYAPSPNENSNNWQFMTNILLKAGYTKDEIVESGLAKRSTKNPERLYDTFTGRTIFPIVDLKDNIIGFGGRILSSDDDRPKYLNTGETPVFNKGKNLFSMNHAKKSDTESLILCEGYMDVIAMNQAGFKEAIATLGTAITPDQARLISLYTDKVICAYDNDNAGFNAKKKAVERLSEQGVEVRVLNMAGIDAKDPDEYIKKYGADAFRQVLETKTESAVDWIIRVGTESFDLNTEEGKWNLANNLVKPLSVLPETERNLYYAMLEQKFDITFGMTKKQAIAEIEEISPVETKKPAPQAKKLHEYNPETNIASCGLPEYLSDELGQNGIITVGELLNLSVNDFQVLFPDDVKTVKYLCELTDTELNMSHESIGE